MFSRYKYCLFFILPLSIFSCDNENSGQDLNESITGTEFVEIMPEEKTFGFSGFDKNGYRYGESSIILSDGRKKHINWKIYQNPINKLTVSIPSNWIVKPEENTFFFAKLNKTEDDFFICMKYDKSEYELTLDKFVNHFYEILMKDTSEVCTSPITREHVFPNKTVYYFECDMILGKKKFITYSYITEDGENIYEFSMKFQSEYEENFNKLIFDSIVDNIFIDEKPLINGDKGSVVVEDIEIGIK